MPILVKANGVDITNKLRNGSLSIQNKSYAQTGILSFDTLDYIVPKEAEITISGVYGGYARQINSSLFDVPGHTTLSVRCQDYTSLCSDDLSTSDHSFDAHPTWTDKDVINWLFTTFGTKGITITATVQVLRATMPSMVFKGKNLATCLNAICDITGGSWYVDYSKKVHYFITESATAPFGLSDNPNNSTTYGYADFKLDDDTTGIKNAVYVVGNGIEQWYTDDASIAAYGRREAGITDNRITTSGTMDSYGASFLLDNSDPKRKGSLTTWTSGFAAGQIVNIYNADYSLSGAPYRITSITTKYPTFTKPVYMVQFGDPDQNLADQIGSIIGKLGQVPEHIDQGYINSVAMDVANGIIRPIALNTLPTLPNAAYPIGGALVLLTTDGKLYRNVANVWTAAVASVDVTGQIVATLPTLPNAAYPNGCFVCLTTDHKIYRNNAGTWTSGVAGGDVSGAVANATNAVNASTAAVASAVAAADITGQITSTQITDASISTPKIAAGAVTASGIAAHTITAGQILAGTITATEIAAHTITAAGIAAGTITSTEIAANTITAGDIAANTITAGQIAAATITASEMAADSITATQIATGAVTADSILAGSIGAAAIAAGAITTRELSVGDPSTGNLLVNGSFENAEGDGHTNYQTVATNLTGYTMGASGGNAKARFGSSGYAITGTRVAQIGVQSGTPTYCYINQYVPVIAGRRYRLGGWYCRAAGSAGAAQIVVHTADAAKASVAVNVIVTTSRTATTMAQYFGEYTVPADGSVSFLNIQLRLTSSPSSDAIAVFDDVVLTLLPAGLQNAAANVTINENGIEIDNGVLTLKDNFGTSVLSGGGFAGPWADAILNSVYNSMYASATAGALTLGTSATDAAGYTSNLPYWWNWKPSGSGTSTVVASSSYPGGNYIQDAFSATGSFTSNSVCHTTDLFTVEPGREVYVGAYYAINCAAGSVFVVARMLWYDAAGTYISTDSPLTNSEITKALCFNSGMTLVTAPINARFARITIGTYETTTHSASNYVRLGGVVVWPALAQAAIDLAATYEFYGLTVDNDAYIGHDGTINHNLKVNGSSGFNGTSPLAKPTVTGSRGGNAALASLLTALANYGLITDSTS